MGSPTFIRCTRKVETVRFIEKHELPGVTVIEPDVFHDNGVFFSLEAGGPINTQRVESAQLSYSIIIHARFAAPCVDFMPSRPSARQLVRVLAGNRIRPCCGYPARVAHLAQMARVRTLGPRTFARSTFRRDNLTASLSLARLPISSTSAPIFYNPEDQSESYGTVRCLSALRGPFSEPLLSRRKNSRAAMARAHRDEFNILTPNPYRTEVSEKCKGEFNHRWPQGQPGPCLRAPLRVGGWAPVA